MPPIDFDFQKGQGTIRVGDAINAEMQPYTDAQGRPTKLVDTGVQHNPRLAGLCGQGGEAPRELAATRDALGIHRAKRRPR